MSTVYWENEVQLNGQSPRSRVTHLTHFSFGCLFSMSMTRTSENLKRMAYTYQCFLSRVNSEVHEIRPVLACWLYELDFKDIIHS